MLACLWCAPGQFTARCSKGLLNHLTTMHPGERLGEMHARQLQFHNKRVCMGCGAIRAGSARQCQLCGRCPATRPPEAGDAIVVRADVVATAIASDNAEVGTLGADRARVANGNSEPNGA